MALPLPASVQSIEITREDDGAPLLLRALLRRSLAKQSKPAARLPVVERTPQQLELLRQATRALRKAQDDKTRAQARLLRAELLISLNSLTLARHDLDRGLPVIKDASLLTQARSLLTSATELPRLPGNPLTCQGRTLDWRELSHLPSTGDQRAARECRLSIARMPRRH